jgi:uncharacterized protein with PQ loop repeat
MAQLSDKGVKLKLHDTSIIASPCECAPVPTWSVYFMLFMGMGSLVVACGIVWQAIQVFRTDDTSGMNGFTFATLALSSFMWFIYTMFIMRPVSRLLNISALLSFVSYLIIFIYIVK